MSTPEDTIDKLKVLIKQHLLASGVPEKIEEVVKVKGRDGAIDVLTREGVVDKVIMEMRNTSLNKENRDIAQVVLPEQLPADLPEKGKQFLSVSITQGRAFLDDISNEDSSSTLQLHLQLMGRRVRSKPVPACCEPAFDEEFFFCLDQPDKRGHLLTCTQELLLSVVRTDHSGTRRLLGSYSVVWRKVLDHGEGLTVLCEVSGTVAECGVSVGVVTLRLKLFPALSERVNSELLVSQLSLEHTRSIERERLFLLYSKQWWNEYLALRPSHADRLVKIFAESPLQDEQDRSGLVCLSLSPLRCAMIESPRHAARFVSLIPCHSTTQVGGGIREQWLSLHAFIASTSGDVENHCLLLCSLLLGFGLDSYVCVGTKARGTPHLWVMTVSNDEPTFWDAVTGQRYTSHDTPPYKSIDSVFNHTHFYANTQPSNSVTKTKYALRDPVLWKGMSDEAIKSMRDAADPHVNSISLLPSVIDPYHTAATMERQLRRLVRDERENNDLSTHWNKDLSHLLLPALSAYELERAAGVTIDTDEFQQAIRHAVPSGFTFKGYPSQFNHLNVRGIFRDCMKSNVCSDVILCHGDSIQLALKVKITTYPEDVIAVWIMFACQYRCIV